MDGPVKKTQWSHTPITFYEEYLDLISSPQTDALVIEANMQGWTIGKVLVNASSHNLVQQ
jgi:hypothetical protein